MRRIIFTTSLLAVILAATMTPQSKSKATAKIAVPAAPAYGNADSISQEEMKIYLYFLASDQLEGRNLPSRGFDTAALYVASHLAEWGLKPGGSTTGTNGPLQPYFMPFELVTKSVIAEQSKASLTAAGAGGGGRGGRGAGGGGGGGGGARRGGGGNGEPRTTDFEYGKDWTMAGGGRGAAPLDALDLSGKLAFAGNGYIINKTSTDPFQGLDVKGKIVVVAGLPAELAAQQNAGRGGGGGGRGANPLGEACKDFMNPEQAAAKNGALAVITLPNFQQLTQQANPNAAGGFGGGGGGRGGLNGPNYTVPKLRADAACPAVPSISAGLTLTNALFQGEKESAQQIFYAAGANTKQTSFELAADKSIKLHVAVKSESNHAENVIGILEGGDPVKKNEYVIMSAHLDHVGIAQPDANGHNINNGADDDGSGSAGLMAVARSYAEGAAKGMRPDRTIIFLWNAGEEKGLWGSQYFNEYPPIDLSKVVVDLNMDMIGRTKGPGFSDPDVTHVLVEPGEMMVIGPNISSDDLEKTLESVNGNYQKLKLNHFWDATKPDATHDNLGPQPNGQRVFYRSDHYNFAKMGIPIAFFTTGLHPDYHRTTDTPDKIDYKEMQVISKTLAAVGWTIANQQGRPLLKDLPEQLIKDMKTAKEQGWGKVTPVLAPLPGEPY
jgi:Zn-dependent M28 family amino/carboxypeptidase